MRRTKNLENVIYQRKYKDIYNLLFNADLEEIADYSNWYKNNPGYVEKNRPLWIIIESKILNKRIWITEDFGTLEITTADLNLDCKTNEYINSFKHKKFNNRQEMTKYLEKLLEPCLKEYMKEQRNENVDRENSENREDKRYKIGIYDTKEDYKQGKFFIYGTVENLEDGKFILDTIMKDKKPSYYSGYVLDTKTGIEEYAFYSDEQQKDENEEQDEEDYL